MKLDNNNMNQIKRHILVWLIIIVYLNLNAPVPGSWAAKIIGGLVESFNYMFVFYTVSRFIIPYFWMKRRYFWLLSTVVICYTIYVFLSWLNYLNIIPNLGGYSFHEDEPLFYLALDGVYYFFIVGSAAGASFYYHFSRNQIKSQSEKEKVLLVKELNFLKNQFNSHITFNFLNYCYSKIHKLLPEVAESIGLYSEVLRYSLETNPQDKIPLKSEITHFSDYIDLQELSNLNVKASFKCEGEIEGKYIFPRILISILEIIFNWGLKNETHSIIHAQVVVLNAKLKLNIDYRSNQNKLESDLSSDFNYVIQTLNLYYNNGYKLSQIVEEGTCSIELILDLESPDYYSEESHSPLVINDKNSKISNNINSPDPGLKSLKRLNNKQIKRHILVWILLFTYSNIIGGIHGSIQALIICFALLYLNYIFVYYIISLFIFPKYWQTNKYKLSLSIFGVLLIYWFNGYIIFKVIMPSVNIIVDFQAYSTFRFFKQLFYFFVLFGSAALVSFLSRFGLYKLKQHEQREKMLLAKELFFIKNRFNSSLTFCFLNHCRAETLSYLPETAESIRIFSDLLHYTHQTGCEEKVKLSKEILYIKNFISIQKLLTEKVFVDFSSSGKLESCKIVPRILVTFVENAFKHGIINDSSFPIRISLSYTDYKLIFSVQNSIYAHKKLPGTHKGLENVAQILELYYPNRHSLCTSDNDGVFSVVLEMYMEPGRMKTKDRWPERLSNLNVPV
jgi:two-component system, LytTR family, sensor kinase